MYKQLYIDEQLLKCMTFVVQIYFVKFLILMGTIKNSFYSSDYCLGPIYYYWPLINQRDL